MTDLKAGIYQHYKGPLYLVLGLAHDANEEGREVVVYVPLQLDEAHTGARLAVRTVFDFFVEVCIDVGCPRYGQKPRLFHDMEHAEAARDGRVLPPECHFAARFTYLGPRYGG